MPKSFWKIYWFLNFYILQLQMMKAEKIDSNVTLYICHLLLFFFQPLLFDIVRDMTELSDPWLDLVQLLHIYHVPINLIYRNWPSQQLWIKIKMKKKHAKLLVAFFLDREKNQEVLRIQVKENKENSHSGTRWAEIK